MVPRKLKLKLCAPAVQVKVPVKAPKAAELYVTVTVPLEDGLTVTDGVTVNCVAAGAAQVTVTGTKPGFWKLIVAVVAGPLGACGGKFKVPPVAGAEVIGVALVVPESGKLNACAPALQFKVPVKVPAAALV